MLRRPSAQRRTRPKDDIDLPLVPVMDTFVTLIAFLIGAALALNVTLIDTPVPVVSTKPPENKDRPLALTVQITNDKLRIYSPFNRRINAEILRTEETHDLVKFHDELLAIKQNHPLETQIIFMPDANVEYDHLVQLMDASRKIEEGDEPLYVKNQETGEDIVILKLFPDVVFGNILGGS